MDKVIIDGIDVSECKYYDDGTCCDKDVMSLSCENTDCIYKQLQRAKAENEELKNQYSFSTILKIDELEQENERLKEELRVAQLNRMTMFEKLDIVNEKDTYKQALQEIREIAEKMYNTNDEDIERDFHIELQAKINEVIGVE